MTDRPAPNALNDIVDRLADAVLERVIERVVAGVRARLDDTIAVAVAIAHPPAANDAEPELVLAEIARSPAADPPPIVSEPKRARWRETPPGRMRERSKGGKLPSASTVRIMTLLLAGKTPKEIAAEVGCSATNVTQQRKKWLVRDGDAEEEPDPDPPSAEQPSPDHEPNPDPEPEPAPALRRPDDVRPLAERVAEVRALPASTRITRVPMDARALVPIPAHMVGPQPRTKRMIDLLREGKSTKEVAELVARCEQTVIQARSRWAPDLVPRRAPKPEPVRVVRKPSNRVHVHHDGDGEDDEPPVSTAQVDAAIARMDELPAEAFDPAPELGFHPCRSDDCHNVVLHEANSRDCYFGSHRGAGR